MPATSTTTTTAATHTRHAAHSRAWRVLVRTPRDLSTLGSGAAGGRRAGLDDMIERRVGVEIERMAVVAERVLGEMEY
jgi:hypothetical protein